MVVWLQEFRGASAAGRGAERGEPERELAAAGAEGRRRAALAHAREEERVRTGTRQTDHGWCGQ